MNDVTPGESGSAEPTDPSPTGVGDTVTGTYSGDGPEHHASASLRSGVAIMLVGALVLLVGMLATTSSHGGNAECPEGTVLVSKFNFTRGKYVFEKPAGNKDVVTISGADAKGGAWTSTTAISAIIVKGGPGSKTTTMTPAQKSGTFSNKDLPEVGRGNTPDISNIQFCGPTTPVTTTTASTTTASTLPPTTESTIPPTTESTLPPTTESTLPPTTESTIPPTTESTLPPTTESTIPPTTEKPDVQGEVIVKTSITPDDAAVEGNSVPRALAFTGGSSLPLVILGTILLIAGATLALVARSRQRQAEA